MSYIGATPLIGNYQKCDAITTSATDTFNLLVGGVAVSPATPQNCIVSLNGVVQAPTSAYTVSGSTIVFASALTTSDVIDFIVILGNVLDLGTPSDDTVTAAKLNDTVISGQTALGEAPADTDEFLVSDAGVLKRLDYSYIKGGGKIGQVVQDTLATVTSVSTSGSFANITGLAAAITPTATDSKVLILVKLGGISNTVVSTKTFFQITGGNAASYVGADNGGGGFQVASMDTNARAIYGQYDTSMMYLDSPATTSEVTYQVQWMCDNGVSWLGTSTTDNAESGYTMSTINVLEVLA